MSAFLPPLLSESDQTAVVAAAYENRLCAAVAELSLHPASVQRTRAEVPAFAAALDAADDWQAMRIAESLRQLAVDTSTDAKVRVPLAKELLRQRPPSAWTQAKRAGRTRSSPTSPASPTPSRRPTCPTTPARRETPAATRSPPPRWTDSTIEQPNKPSPRSSSPDGRPALPEDGTDHLDDSVHELQADPLLGPLLHPPPELTAPLADQFDGLGQATD